MFLSRRAKVRCDQCGYLTLRNSLTGSLHEAPETYRAAADQQLTALDVAPLCFMRRRNFRQEIEDEQGSALVAGGVVLSEKSIVLGLISQEFHCEDFRRWQLGFSPKEHREEQEREKLVGLMKSQHRAELLILGGAVVFATIVGSMMEAGWVGRWFGISI